MSNTKRITFTTSVSTVRESFRPKATYEVDEQFAREMFAAGFAVEADPDPKPEAPKVELVEAKPAKSQDKPKAK